MRNFTISKPYGKRYESLRRSILASATDTWDALDAAHVEIVSGLFRVYFETETGCPEIQNGYQGLRHLHDTGALDSTADWLTLPLMHRHDVVLALALHENEIANFLLGDSIGDYGWEEAEARKLGLEAAVSAAECHAWAISLKDECARSLGTSFVGKRCRESDVPKTWVFRPATSVPKGSWRRPRVVWCDSKFLKRGRPQMRAIEAGSRQLHALAAAAGYVMAMSDRTPRSTYH